MLNASIRYCAQKIRINYLNGSQHLSRVRDKVNQSVNTVFFI